LAAAERPRAPSGHSQPVLQQSKTEIRRSPRKLIDLELLKMSAFGAAEMTLVPEG